MAAPTAVATTSNTREKPRLSFWQIWNMSFGFLGIQFGFALQNSNISRIFETMGAKTDEIAFRGWRRPSPACWCSPSSAIFSDRTWSPRWGRRRPYFFVGAVAGLPGPGRDAQRDGPLDGGRHALDSGFEHQHFDGAVPGAGRRFAALAAAHHGLRRPDVLHRRGRHGGLVAALDVYQLVRRVQHARAGPHSRCR